MTAEFLIENRDVKFLFVGGKGGVGKTTTSAAIAMQLSYDRKVLLLSTDPAHSLSDAFRENFTEEPLAVQGVPNLEVLEVNPDKVLASEVERWKNEAEEAGFTELLTNVKEFQEWLISVPGIDEATALSGVISYIEKGQYDVIVFDTAPTGHTLKLLQLPKVLEAGLNKLNSWQSKIWGYWSAIKGVSSGRQTNLKKIQDKVTKRLEEYKTSIEKIGVMLKDQQRTNFAIVCIAEHLSINESIRLLKELKHYGITVSHIFVNQLVKNALDVDEMKTLNAILEKAKSSCDSSELESLQQMLPKLEKSIQLCNSRKNIQQKYLKELKQSEYVTNISTTTTTTTTTNGITVVEVPLLSSEVTGIPALLSFSQLLMPENYRSEKPSELKEWKPSPFAVNIPKANPEVKENQETENNEKAEVEFCVGDSVRLEGLKAQKYNGLLCKVVSKINDKGRIGVLVEGKTLLIKKVNLVKIEDSPSKEPAIDKTQTSSDSSGMDQLKNKILADPEVQEKLKNPKFKKAWDEVQTNPAMAFQYMSDPEIGPFIMKMMAKLKS